MKKFLKILGVTVLSFAIVFASCFIPIKFKQSETLLNNASAASIPSNSIPPVTPDGDYTQFEAVSFIGSDLFFYDLMSMPTNSYVTDFSDYIENGQFISSSDKYRFQLGLNIGISSASVRYKAIQNHNALRYIRSPFITGYQDSIDINSFQSANLPGVSLSLIRQNFVPNDIFNMYSFSDMQFCRENNSTVGYFNFGFQIFRNNTNTSDFVVPTFEMRYLCILNYTEINSILGLPYNSSFDGSNVVCYIDTAGYYYLFYINTGNLNNENGQYYFLSYRRYILSEEDFSDNEYYQQGVQDGYTDGYNDGESIGYTDGYNVGDKAGFIRGYNEGLNTADSYTFYNLIGAVFDAPLNTFSSLFNFEILGVNILNFLSSILTLCIVIWLIKLALGGK